MRIKAMLIVAMYSLALVSLMTMMTGCETVRTVYHACKDGNCR